MAGAHLFVWLGLVSNRLIFRWADAVLSYGWGLSPAASSFVGLMLFFGTAGACLQPPHLSLG